MAADEKAYRFGPVKQYMDDKVDAPLTLRIYPGKDGAFTLYEDDGKSFDYRKGEWMGIGIEGIPIEVQA